MENFHLILEHLNNNGYVHDCALCYNSFPTDVRTHNDGRDSWNTVIRSLEKPLFQAVDVIVDSTGQDRTPEQHQIFQDFLHTLGNKTSNLPNPIMSRSMTPMPQRGGVRQDAAARQEFIAEFIQTEERYVKTLQVIDKYFAKPLQQASLKRQPILKKWECKQIFINIDQILAVNTAFLKDLHNMKSEEEFGNICLKHMTPFECYSKFLLGMETSIQTEKKEQKQNAMYRGFLARAREVPEVRRKMLSDLLAEPGQRIGRYSMLLEKLIGCTPADYPDYLGLRRSFRKAQEIATMADDNHTKQAKVLFSMLAAISDCPDTLISQHRQFVHLIDATEVDIATNRPIRPVTLFLFSDKLMVARRPSYHCNGMDISGVKEPMTPNSPNQFFESVLSRKAAEKMKRTGMKFRGWIDIEEVELFEGPRGQTTSFMVRAKDNAESGTPAYFQEQPLRLYNVHPPSEESAGKSLKVSSADKVDFISEFHKIKSTLTRGEDYMATYYRKWGQTDVYTALYDPEQYCVSPYKSSVAIYYIDEDGFNVDKWVPCVVQDTGGGGETALAGLVFPNSGAGCRFIMKSKRFLPGVNSPANARAPLLDFPSVFWNNILHFEAQYQASLRNIPQRYDFMRDPSSPSADRKSRAVSKTRSIPNLAKMFSSGVPSNTPVSPTLSPTHVTITSSQTPSATTSTDSLYNSRSSLHSVRSSSGDYQLYRSPSSCSTVRTWVSTESGFTTTSSAADSIFTNNSDDTNTSMIPSASNSSSPGPHGSRAARMSGVIRNKTQAQSSKEILEKLLASTNAIDQLCEHSFNEAAAASTRQKEDMQVIKSQVVTLRCAFERELHRQEPERFTNASQEDNDDLLDIEKAVEQMMQRGEFMPKEEVEKFAGKSLPEIGLNLLEDMNDTINDMQERWEERWGDLMSNYQTVRNQVRSLSENWTEASNDDVSTRQSVNQSSYEDTRSMDIFGKELDQVLGLNSNDHNKSETADRKLQTAIQERNLWQQKARLLARQLAQAKQGDKDL